MRSEVFVYLVTIEHVMWYSGIDLPSPYRIQRRSLPEHGPRAYCLPSSPTAALQTLAQTKARSSASH